MFQQPVSPIPPSNPAVFTAARTAYVFTSYTDHTEVRSLNAVAPTRTIEVALQKPGNVRLEVGAAAEPGKPIRLLVCRDGRLLDTLDTTDSSQSSEIAETVRQGSGFQHIFRRAGMDATGTLDSLLTGRDPLASFGKRLKSVGPGQPSTVDGVPVETVVAVVGTPSGGSLTITYAFGISDHLLRRVTTERSEAGKLLTVIETHSQIRLNPLVPDTAFHFPTSVAHTEASSEWTGQDLNGKPFSLASYKGRVLVVNFAETGCGACPLAPMFSHRQSVVAEGGNQRFLFGLVQIDERQAYWPN